MTRARGWWNRERGWHPTPAPTVRNAASLLLPSLDSRCFVFTRWLYLDSQLAIDVGREVWGFPKYRAELSFERSESGGRGGSRRTVLAHQTLTVDGKEILRARLELEQTRGRIFSWPGSSSGPSVSGGC